MFLNIKFVINTSIISYMKSIKQIKYIDENKKISVIYTEIFYMKIMKLYLFSKFEESKPEKQSNHEK